MIRIWRSHDYDAAVFLAALASVFFLINIPPLNVGGVSVWFFTFPIFFVVRLMSLAPSILFLVLVSFLNYDSIGDDASQVAAQSVGMIVFFSLLALLNKRLPHKWLFQSTMVLHLLIELPLQVALRKIITSVSWPQAYFESLGYSLGLLISMILFWSSIALIKETRIGPLRRVGEVLGHRPSGAQIFELAIATLLILSLTVFLSIFGKKSYDYQYQLMMADVDRMYDTAFYQYENSLESRAEAALKAVYSSREFGGDARIEPPVTRGLFREVFFGFGRQEIADSTHVAIVFDGEMSIDETISHDDVVDALAVANGIAPAIDGIVALELARPSRVPIPVHVISSPQGHALIFYQARETLLAFQEREIQRLNDGFSRTAADAQTKSHAKEKLERAVTTENHSSNFASNAASTSSLPAILEANEWKAETASDLQSRRSTRIEIGQDTVIKHTIPHSMKEDVSRFFLAPEEYTLTTNYSQYFETYMSGVAFGALLGMVLLQIFLPLCRYATESTFETLSDLTRIVDSWRNSPAGELGSSAAFQLMRQKQRSLIEEFFQLQRVFQLLANDMMHNERRLTTIAANYDELLRSLPLGVLAADQEGRTHFVNDALSEIIGTSSEALNKIKKKAVAMIEEKQRVEEWQLPQDSDIPKSLLLVVTARLNQKGQESGVWVIVTDLTPQKQTHAKLVQASKLATLGEMSTGMAHEINQPLNIISLAASNLRISLKRGHVDWDSIAPRLDRIDDALRRASTIIDHMRAYGRTSGDEWGRLDIGGITCNVCSLLRDQLALLNIDLVNNLPQGDIFVEGNAVQFEQVIINLISNAKDAIAELEGAQGQISIDGTVKDDRVLIRVSDTGPGIPDAVLPHIFEPFFTTKPIGKGTGLGGSISYGIVREMHGDIWAENTGAGARVTVSLPLIADA